MKENEVHFEPSFLTKWERDDYERNKNGLKELGPIGYCDYSLSDRLRFAARMSAASKEICQLMDDAANELDLRKQR